MSDAPAPPAGPAARRSRLTGRRSFAPLVLAGLAAGTLAAVAATRPAARAVGVPDDALVGDQPPADLPLAAALALVVLAAWGAALVTRRRARRVALVVGLLAALGTVAALAVGLGSLPDDVREPYLAAGLEGVEVSFTAAYLATWVGAVLSVPVLALGVRAAPDWPEMSSRYDAPAAHAAPGAPAAAGSAAPTTGAAGTTTGSDSAAGEVDGASDLELWRALDEGRDPTDGPDQ